MLGVYFLLWLMTNSVYVCVLVLTIHVIIVLALNDDTRILCNILLARAWGLYIQVKALGQNDHCFEEIEIF